MPNENYYLNTGTYTSFITVTGEGQTTWSADSSIKVIQEEGIHPRLYFSYAKKKFGMIESVRLSKNLKRIEKAFEEAVKNGQTALAEKFINSIGIATRESQMTAKGVKYFVERDDIMKHKHRIKGGHISDTKLEEFTRVIPKGVIKKLDKVRELFDGFVIFHYWSNEASDVKNMSPKEKEKMRDPILFGIIKNNNRLYFIADWEDEYCDLTFDEVIDVMGKEDEDFEIKPLANIN